MKLEDIIEAYMVARKNKRKSPDQVEFELHWELNCVVLCEAVNNRCYQPTAYTFVADHPKPREVFASDMSTRILHHYLDMRLRPFLEERMGEHTFNNRIVRRAKTKARQFNRCIRPEKIEPMLASINSYLGICKNVNGYNQARAIVATLSSKWFEYVNFNTHRVCLQAKPEYKINELLTQKYKLYEQNRKRRDASASQRRAVGSDVNNESVRRSREQVHQDGSQLPG